MTEHESQDIIDEAALNLVRPPFEGMTQVQIEDRYTNEIIKVAYQRGYDAGRTDAVT